MSNKPAPPPTAPPMMGVSEVLEGVEGDVASEDVPAVELPFGGGASPIAPDVTTKSFKYTVVYSSTQK